MDQRVYHGTITPNDIASSLVGHFNRGNLRVQQVNNGEQTIVQISTTNNPSSGGQTAISIIMHAIEDGVTVDVGQQSWLGVAADLGSTAFATLRNPLNIFSRLDDIAQDIEYIQLTDEVWNVIEETAKNLSSSHLLSDRLRRLECRYCGTANPVGSSNCIACGAPLGDVQPNTCKKCGYVLAVNERVCPNCGTGQ
jgi:hypothetical protein